MKQEPAGEGRDTAAEAVFEAKDLRKEYDEGRVQALRGVNFRILPGEFITIVGQSGSGKSTLLQLLGALDSATAGSLLYRGKELSRLPDLSAYRAHDIGFIFQAFHLLPTFTALENVQIPMFESKRSSAERQERALSLLKAVGLGERVNHLPSKLSGGERQRVAIARSLANNPSVLLADEPTGNLDSENARQTLDLLTQLHEERKVTLVLVTHDPNVARSASRALQIRDGHVVYDGPPSGISFGGTP